MNIKQWRKENKEQIKAYNKSYWTNWYAKNKAKKMQLDKEWRKNHPEYFIKYNKKFRSKPEQIFKNKARQKLRNSVLRGKMQRQNCEIDGCFNKAEAHHDDYNKPLDVKWLCRQHHGNK